MCGIAGFATGPGNDQTISRALLDSLSSRGPDRSASGVHGGYCLAQTRLAVVDLSPDVVYPMPNEREDVWLLFNGEIYDHPRLRRELEGLGHRFATGCDAEVVLHGYEEWGTDVFPRLNGMFAVALVDERAGTLTLARDRVGIKPLMRLRGPRFAFASEAMALVSAGLSSGEPDHDAIAEFAAFHYVPHPRTGIEDVEQIEPGTALIRGADGDERVVRWAPKPFSRPGEAETVSLEELEESLRQSVARQLLADVEVGIFLSGGIDSSLVAVLAAQSGARPRAFTIGFPGHGDYDEVAAASELAAELGIPHHHRRFAVGFADAVEGVADAYDQPFADPSAAPMLTLASFAREQVTVALSGTGGDDSFAGYYRHRADRLHRLLRVVPEALSTRLARLPLERGSERRGALALGRSYAIRLARAASEDRSDRYLSLVGSMTSSAGIEVFRPPPDTGAARAAVGSRLRVSDGDGPALIREIQGFEFGSYVPGDLLTKEDRATMAFGLEARVPLLDAEILALAERMPERQKASLLRGKLPLRQLASRLLPPSRRGRRKRGFAVPLVNLFDGPWRDEAREWLGSSRSDLVDGSRAADLVTRRPSAALDVWALSTLLAWERRLGKCRRNAPSRHAARVI